MAALRVLAFAVQKGRAGYVYFSNGTLRDWNMSAKAVKSTNDIVGWAQGVINDLKPDVVVTQKLTASCRKGKRTQKLIKSVVELASHNYVLDISVERPDGFDNQYEEATALAKRHNALQALVPPKPKFFQSRPHRLVLFEAVALADAVILGPPERLAAAMG